MPRQDRHVAGTKHPAEASLLLIFAVTCWTTAPCLPQRALAQESATIETVEAGTVAWWSEILLSLDSNAAPHIAYRSNVNSEVRYAAKAGGSWTIETVDSQVGGQIGFAMDPVGKAHILYGKMQNPRYAVRDASTWSTEMLAVRGGHVVAGTTALALDSQGNPHVTYWTLTCGIDCDASFNYAFKTGGSWTEWPTWSCLFSGGEGEIAIDDDDRPFLIASCTSNNGAMYMSPDAWEWLNDVSPYEPIALAVDGQSTSHIVYSTGSSLRYRRKSGATWVSQVIDPAATQSGDSYSLAVDDLGNPRVAYYDGVNRDLRYARKVGSTWRIRTIDGTGFDAGSRTSIAIDAAGRTHIAYLDVTSGAVRYALVTDDATGVPIADDRARSLRVVPNPSVDAVTVAFRVGGEDAIDLAVYDVSGRRIRSLMSGRHSLGEQSITWDRRDDSGHDVSAGTYFLRLTSSNGEQATERVTIIR